MPLPDENDSRQSFFWWKSSGRRNVYAALKIGFPEGVEPSQPEKDGGQVQDRKELQEELIRSAEEIEKRLEVHRRLLRSALREGQVGRGGIRRSAPAPLCDRRAREILLEAIEVLEGTRKAFKSKQLEMLRKKMIRVLAEGSDSLQSE